MRHVVVIGLMGSGKSSVGEPLAERLGRPYLDNDRLLRQRTGRTAREIAEADGIGALHRAEAGSLLAALSSPQPSVVGAAASTVESEEVRAALRRHFVVWLDTDLDVLVDRVGAKDHRPIDGDPRALLEEQHRRRAPLYREVASLVVRGDRSDDGATVESVVEALR